MTAQADPVRGEAIAEVADHADPGGREVPAGGVPEPGHAEPGGRPGVLLKAVPDENALLRSRFGLGEQERKEALRRFLRAGLLGNDQKINVISQPQALELYVLDPAGHVRADPDADPGSLEGPDQLDDPGLGLHDGEQRVPVEIVHQAGVGEDGEVFIFKQDLVADQAIVDRGRGGPDAGLLLTLGGRDRGLGVGRLKAEVLFKVGSDGGCAGNVSFLIVIEGVVDIENDSAYHGMCLS